MSKSSSWGEWFEDARIKTKEFAEKAQVIAVAATKIAQDGAIELGKQAHELREKYDLDLATSALISTIGGRPADSSSSYRQRASNNPGQQRKSVLDLVYITENLISMSFPYDFKKNGRRNGEDGNDISIVSKFLKQKHGSHFMIWNVSENSYDYSYFGDQVLEYSFPGHPAPPLGLLFNICTSVESWLDADEKNVAVLHCLTGRGRTAALMSCILTWIGEFTSPVEALQYVAERRGTLILSPVCCPFSLHLYNFFSVKDALYWYWYWYCTSAALLLLMITDTCAFVHCNIIRMLSSYTSCAAATYRTKNQLRQEYFRGYTSRC